MSVHIADLDNFTHSVPGIIVYIAGIFHIATAVWKYFVGFIKLVILGLRQIRREVRKMLDEIANASAPRPRRKGCQR